MGRKKMGRFLTGTGYVVERQIKQIRGEIAPCKVPWERPVNRKYIGKF